MTRDVPGVNYDNVSRFFRENVPGGECELSFELIAGGKSNVTYLVRGGEHSWVLRRPPLGHVLPTAHDMAREYRVLTALKDTGVPVPRTIALCTDEAVNDSPFYVMTYTPGVVLLNELPAGYATTPGERRRMCEAMIDTLVKLHAVDYHAVGLDDFGRPDGYLERQVRRWSQQWERSKTSELPEIESLIPRLQRALPPSPPPTIVHGDYRLGNMALDPDDPGRVVAIFDWEMSTLGDPLADLGYCLIYWVDRGEDFSTGSIGTASAFTTLEGFMSRAELIEEYAVRSGRDVSSADFYQVLALYKLAIISEGIYARFIKGQTLGDDFKNTMRAAEPLAKRALEIANNSSDPKLRG
jgi:aminoglycoside phosphotransferase (APT) family kinase protein